MPYTLITGASSGIGEEFAKQCAAKRQNLILVSRSEDKLQKLSNELKNAYPIDIKIIVLDLATNQSAEQVFERCQKENLEVNFLINNAGIGLIGKFDHFDVKKIEEMLLLNVLTLTKLTYLFIPQLKINRGIIINLSSQVAFSPAPYMASYAGTKAYVQSFTEAIQNEYENEGIKILALCPGPTYTKFFERTKASPHDINFKFRQPKDVVDEAFNALNKNKSVVLVGWENKVMTFFLRFMPRKLLTKFSSTFVKNGDRKP
ncbi:MAG: SDR family oxidoreductase [Parachlamydiaceae bacterium]|nr:SDR family oxidoreductase [Parachlamydiaceae bacterium]